MGGALVAAGPVMANVGAQMKSNADLAAANANVTIDKSNEQIAREAAGTARANGQQQAGMRAMQGGRLIGSQKAGFAASGVATNSGSALDVLADTAMISKADQDVIQNNAARTAWGYDTQATNFENKSRFDKNAGDAASDADILGGVSNSISSLSGAMKIGG